MLPGLNHNVRYKERRFHVQTEDSGLNRPVLKTHVFFDGFIVASESSDYQELLDSNPTQAERELGVRKQMQDQHKDAIKALLRGIYDPSIARFIPEIMEAPPATAELPPPPMSRSSVPPPATTRVPRASQPPQKRADAPVAEVPSSTAPVPANLLDLGDAAGVDPAEQPLAPLPKIQLPELDDVVTTLRTGPIDVPIPDSENPGTELPPLPELPEVPVPDGVEPSADEIEQLSSRPAAPSVLRELTLDDRKPIHLQPSKLPYLVNPDLLPDQQRSPEDPAELASTREDSLPEELQRYAPNDTLLDVPAIELVEELRGSRPMPAGVRRIPPKDESTVFDEGIRVRMNETARKSPPEPEWQRANTDPAPPGVPQKSTRPQTRPRSVRRYDSDEPLPSYDRNPHYRPTEAPPPPKAKIPPPSWPPPPPSSKIPWGESVDTAPTQRPQRGLSPTEEVARTAPPSKVNAIRVEERGLDDIILGYLDQDKKK